MNADNIDARLVNWGRAMRVHPTMHACRSIEGRYRSRQRDHWEKPIAGFWGTIDVGDAWDMEQAAITLPTPDLALLRAFYVARLHPNSIRRICRRLGRRDFGVFHVELTRTQNTIAQRLTLTLACKRKLHSLIGRARLDNAIYGVGHSPTIRYHSA